jgi:site-specific DNA-cytosine methylase
VPSSCQKDSHHPIRRRIYFDAANGLRASSIAPYPKSREAPIIQPVHLFSTCHSLLRPNLRYGPCVLTMNSAPAATSGLRAVELFAGIGGFRLASDYAGMVTIWANDLSEKACTVYRSQFSKYEISCGNFGTLSDMVPEHDVLTAGFPCQPFSCAGKKQGIRDSRGTLFYHIIATHKSHRPRYFVLENVKTLLSMGNGRHFAAVLGRLEALDYSIEWSLLNACHFGLPPNYERLFIVGELCTDSGCRPRKVHQRPIKIGTPTCRPPRRTPHRSSEGERRSDRADLLPRPPVSRWLPV